MARPTITEWLGYTPLRPSDSRYVELTTPIAASPADPMNWREIDRLKRLAEAEGRTFNTDDPYNWGGIARFNQYVAQYGDPFTDQPSGPGPGGEGGGSNTGGGGSEDEQEDEETGPDAGEAAAQARRNRDMFDLLAQVIREAGLEGLFSVSSDGTPSGPLWDVITSGVDSQAALIAWLENTQQFKTRFPVIAELRGRAAAGESVTIPTPREVREYEERVGAVMRNAGIPIDMYDTFEERQQLMARGLSVVEVEERLGEAWNRVRNTSPEVMAAFTDFYGMEGANMMAAVFLDPEMTLSKLNQMSRTAYTAGMGTVMGLNLLRGDTYQIQMLGRSQLMAERIAGLPVSEAGVVEGLQQVSQMNRAGGVFFETMGETEDLTAENTGLEAQFFGSPEARKQIEQRLLERQAGRQVAAGGALTTQAGVTGLGMT